MFKDEEPAEHVNIEFWGLAIPEGIWGNYGDFWDPDVGTKGAATNNTYKGLRVKSEDYSLYYSVWCSGEKEYYDTKVPKINQRSYMSLGRVKKNAS